MNRAQFQAMLRMNRDMFPSIRVPKVSVRGTAMAEMAMVLECMLEGSSVSVHVYCDLRAMCEAHPPVAEAIETFTERGGLLVIAHGESDREWASEFADSVSALRCQPGPASGARFCVCDGRMLIIYRADGDSVRYEWTFLDRERSNELVMTLHERA